MRHVGVLPTLVTIANGYCGLLAIYKVNDGKFHVAAFLIMLAMVFDVLDGKVARMAGTTSKFGAQLDSLSDAISFGAAPGFLVKGVIESHDFAYYQPKLLTLLTAVFALCALLRLARYNAEHSSGEGSDEEGKEVSAFSGIPTPGAAGVLASLTFMATEEGLLPADGGTNFYTVVLAALPPLCFILGFLMISQVRYVHFGSRFLQGRRDFRYMFLIVFAAALMTRYPEEFLAAAFCIYAISGPLTAPFVRGSVEKEKIEIPDGL